MPWSRRVLPPERWTRWQKRPEVRAGQGFTLSTRKVKEKMRTRKIKRASLTDLLDHITSRLSLGDIRPREGQLLNEADVPGRDLRAITRVDGQVFGP